MHELPGSKALRRRSIALLLNMRPGDFKYALGWQSGKVSELLGGEIDVQSPHEADKIVSLLAERLYELFQEAPRRG